MKKFLTFILVFVAALLLVACGQKVVVEFDTNGGNSIANIELEDINDFKLPTAPTKEGYEFKGWYLDADFTKEFKSLEGLEGTVKLYAKWEEKVVEATKYTVTFKGKDGAVIETQEVEEGKAATAPAAPEVEGFVFKGWDKAFDNVTGDLEVNAVYEEEVVLPTVGTIAEIVAGKMAYMKLQL